MHKLLVLLQYIVAVSAARSVTVNNNCAFTIWPAIFSDPNANSGTNVAQTGWEAPSGFSRSFSVPDNWTTGQIWGRRDCDFSKGSGANSCLTGGCDGGLECDSQTGSPTGPVTVAEFTLSDSSQDFYDVSVVNGFNLPMRVDNSGGCGIVSCPVDLTISCPTELRGPTNADGSVVGCKSACEVDTNPTNSPNCCTGSFSTPSTCPASHVNFYSFFKGNCPQALAFRYDETSVLLPCTNSPDYTVTFCP